MTNESESIIPTTTGDIQHPTVETISPPDSPVANTNIRARWTHNPVVLAALACSNMQSCEEVKTVYREW